jgi:hypothetical protein
MNDTWQKYAGDIGRLFRITSQPPQATSLPESPSNVSPVIPLISKYLCKFDIVNYRGLQTAMSISGTSCKYNFIPLHTEFRLKINRKPIWNSCIWSPQSTTTSSNKHITLSQREVQISMSLSRVYFYFPRETGNGNFHALNLFMNIADIISDME